MYWQTTHRYGIRLPKSIKEAKELDQKNGNTLWWDAITKEMRNVRIAFEDWNKPLSEILPGYSKLTCHLIFEIKLSENFRRKARFVADGHKHPVKPSLSYSTVFSRDSVRITFLLAALNSGRSYLVTFRTHTYRPLVAKSFIMWLVMNLVLRRKRCLLLRGLYTAYEQAVLHFVLFSRNNFMTWDLNPVIWLIQMHGFEPIVNRVEINITNICSRM